jgi:putative endopeptidase
MPLRSGFIAIVLLFAAASAANAAPTARHAAPSRAAGAAHPGKPMFGVAGFDDAGMDKATRPGDDFFRFANGRWIDRTPIPPDLPAYSLRRAMTDRIEQRLHGIMEQAAAHAPRAPKTLEGKVGAFYTSFMDEARVERLGAKPLAATLEEIRAAGSRAQIAALMGRNNSDFEGTLFNLFIDVDLKDPKKYAVYIGQAGLGLPDRDYYLDAKFAAQKSKYQEYVATILRLLDWPHPEDAAKNIVAYESQVAAASWTKTRQRDPVATYNPYSLPGLEALAPGFAWSEFLSAAGLPARDHVIVAEKSAFPKLAGIFARTPIETLQAWLAFTVADNAAPYLSAPFANANFEMRSKTLSGQAEQSVRWKRGVHAVSGGDYGPGDRYDRFGNLGWGVGQLYTARYFPPSAKLKIEALVANLKSAYHARIEKLDWMSAETRKRALEKLDTYTIKVGYPDVPRDYSRVVILADDLIGNVRRAGAADWHFYVSRIEGPVDRRDWGMTPQTNDAYNGSLRDIVFPAGILQPPMFDASADPAFNYGAAGGVIGHELTHGFDDEGRKLDAEGKLNDWWTPADARTFEARAAKFGAQYSKYEPVAGAHVNGALTMGENIADLGGATLALDAYRASLKGRPAPVVDGWTGDQRVLLGWAQAWRGKASDDFLRRQVVSDPHSPRMFRVNGVVRNLDAWYSAFDVRPGEKLYLAPADRVRIW